MYLFVPCDKKSHGTEISFPICSNHLSHPHPLPRDIVRDFRGCHGSCVNDLRSCHSSGRFIVS